MAQKTKKDLKIYLKPLNAIKIFLITLIIFNVFSAVIKVPDKYFKFQYWENFNSLKNIYLSSQYVSKQPKGWIPDETINSYSAGEYIKGISPVLIAADTPPLGRYIIGLSVMVLNNENIPTLIFSFLSLILMYFVGKQIFSSSIISLMPPLIFSFEPIFQNQIIYSPLLDIFQLCFLLLCFYFFNKGYKEEKSLKYYFLANISLGLFISTKFFITGLTILASWYLILFLRKQKKELINLTTTIPFSVLVLFINYIRLFAFGYSLKSFLGVQKYIFLYHKSQLILPFSIWPLLLFNKWYVWFGNDKIISDPQWLVTWPIITVITAATILLYTFKKIQKNENIEVLMAWVFFYVLFFSFGQISSRYFVILIPVLYIISIYGLFSMYKQFKK